MNNNLILKEIREHYGLHRSVDFARFFNISPQLANAWLSRDSLDYQAIYKKCPEINPDWLLSGGEGPMLREDMGREERMLQDESCNTALDNALQALKNEQAISRKAQEQADRLINIVDRMVSSPKE